MRFVIATLIVLSASAAGAADAMVKDGHTIQLGSVTYRLDGIDGPELDQICINNVADPWACGVDARDLLVRLIGRGKVRCEDVGTDRAFGKWHIGVCTVDGSTISLNEQLVRE